MREIYAKYSATILELRKSLSLLLQESKNQPIAILNHNTPSAYLIPALYYEQLIKKLEEYKLLSVIKERLNDKDKAIEVDIDEL